MWHWLLMLYLSAMAKLLMSWRLTPWMMDCFSVHQKMRGSYKIAAILNCLIANNTICDLPTDHFWLYNVCVVFISIVSACGTYAHASAQLFFAVKKVTGSRYGMTRTVADTLERRTLNIEILYRKLWTCSVYWLHCKRKLTRRNPKIDVELMQKRKWTDAKTETNLLNNIIEYRWRTLVLDDDM